MKKGIKILFYTLVILIVLSLTFIVISYNKRNYIATIEAVVVKVNENSLSVMELNNKSLYNVRFTDEGNIGFKIGQQVLIYFDGIIAESYPAQIHNVGKIEIVNDESNILIPENILRFYYSSINNVRVSISELTSKEISLVIIDRNELQYNYSNDFSIYQKVKNEDYTGLGYKIGEDTENSTSGFTRNR